MTLKRDAGSKPGEVVQISQEEFDNLGKDINVIYTGSMTPAELLLNHHKVLTGEALDLMARKNHDYTSGGGDPYANFRMSEALGVHPLVGMAIRMGDKLQRVRTFAEKGQLQVKGEGFRDSILDLINYSILMYGLGTEKDDG